MSGVLQISQQSSNKSITILLMLKCYVNYTTLELLSYRLKLRWIGFNIVSENEVSNWMLTTTKSYQEFSYQLNILSGPPSYGLQTYPCKQKFTKQDFSHTNML